MSELVLNTPNIPSSRSNKRRKASSKKVVARRLDRLQVALKGLLDSDMLYSRKRWAQKLRITTSAIAQWLNPEKPTTPSAAHLRGIYDAFRNLSLNPDDSEDMKIRASFDHFLAEAALPLKETSASHKKFRFRTQLDNPTTLDFLFEYRLNEFCREIFAHSHEVREEIIRIASMIALQSTRYGEENAMNKLESISNSVETTYNP